MQPLVSILIPVYNEKPHFLRQCIDSARSQTYPNLEIIVSDNHCTLAATGEVLNDFRHNTSSIRLVSPSQHLAMGEHFQFVLDQALGEWVTFLCSDDFLDPQFVSTSIACLLSASGGPAFSYCRTSFYSESEGCVVSHVRPRTHGFVSQPASLRRFLSGKEGSFCGLLAKTSALREFTPFPGWLTYSFDLYIEIQLAKRYPAYFVDLSLAICRLHQRVEQDARMTACITDIVRIYQAALQDPLIVSVVTPPYVKRCLLALLQYWIYAYHLHFTSSALPSAILASSKDVILSVDSSLLARALLRIRNRFLFNACLRLRSLLIRVLA